ncbi:MAG: phosphonate transporter [Burkholderiales bacterium PBB4]|nr:MAG: phosphonate transporter [Burkholderiales bacterium PBB4]
MQEHDIAALAYHHSALLQTLDILTALQLDLLNFGVIHFNGQYLVERYNRYEQVHTGLTPEKVLGKHVFTHVAQCMNNFMVARRVEDALTTGATLDTEMDYVLTWRMKPTPVRMRILAAPGPSRGYVVIQRRE